jgi:hypothetical protein
LQALGSERRAWSVMKQSIAIYGIAILDATSCFPIGMWRAPFLKAIQNRQNADAL